MPDWLDVTDIVTGLVVAVILTGLGFLALGLKRSLGAAVKALGRIRPTVAVLPKERFDELWLVLGESTLGRLSFTYDGPNKPSDPPKPEIEIETYAGNQVWAVGLPDDLKGTDLALAAQVKLGAKDQFYRLHHVGAKRDLDPDQAVLAQVSEGDRLRLIPNGPRVWMGQEERGPVRRILAFLRRLVSKKVRFN